jgi:hypothetical protein
MEKMPGLVPLNQLGISINELVVVGRTEFRCGLKFRESAWLLQMGEGGSTPAAEDILGQSFVPSQPTQR